MTAYVLAAFIYIEGQLRSLTAVAPSLPACEQARDALQAKYPKATVLCVPVEKETV